MKAIHSLLATLVAAATLAAAPTALAQDNTIKVGVIAAFSGPFADYGGQIEAGMKAYMKEHGPTDPSDYRPGWGERRHAEMDRHYDRRTSEAFKQATQMLYTKGKLPK